MHELRVRIVLVVLCRLWMKKLARVVGYSGVIPENAFSWKNIL